MRILTHQEIDLIIQEAIADRSVHYKDHSLSEVHSKIQNALTADHRRDYNDYDADDYPFVRDVFGDKDSGHVVYHQSGQHYRSPYKMDNGGYTLGAPEPVQQAYVPMCSSVRESLENSPQVHDAVLIMERFISTGERKSADTSDFAGKGRSFPILKAEDVRAALDSIGRAGSGNHPPEELKRRILEIARRKGFPVPKSDQKAQESAPLPGSEVTISGDCVITLQEADTNGSGNALVKLISPGTGSMGHYSETVLKEAVKSGVFSKGIQMFMDHQTPEERAKKPEGSLSRLMAVTTGDGEYQESGKDGPGVYAKSRVYSDFVPFVRERKDDIGVSIRAGVVPSGRTVNGVPEVKEMKYLLSADFVTKAGRGGKLVEMYESYRGSGTPGTRQSAAGDEQAMTADEQKQFTLLQESNARLTASNSRLSESIARINAGSIVSDALVNEAFNPRGQKRIRDMVLANLPLTDTGDLDTTKFQESLKAAITEEKAYLQESGVVLGTRTVRAQGGSGATPTGSPAFLQESLTGDPEADTKLLQEAGKTTENSINALMGRKEKATA